MKTERTHTKAQGGKREVAKRSVLSGLAAFLCLLVACDPHALALDYSRVENIPIQSGGRKMPLSTFAAETLLSTSGRAEYRDGALRQSAVESLLSMMAEPEAWKDRPAVLVTYKPIKKLLGLPDERKLFSLNELRGNPALAQLPRLLQNAAESPAAPNLPRQKTEMHELYSRIMHLEGVLDGGLQRFVPPANGANSWLPLHKARDEFPGAKGDAVASALAEMNHATKSDDDAKFLAASSRFAETLAVLNPTAYPPERLMKLETTYGKLHPFRWAWILLACATMALWLTTLRARQTGYMVAWILASAGVALIAGGFICRIIIAGRSPVTNMYESVLWAALGVVFFAMLMEAVYRSRYLFLSALPVAVIALILADSQPAVFDPSIRPLAPVLRDNFWLSTHVISITLGYAALALALGVGHIVLIKSLRKRPVTTALTEYLYRSLQIGVLLLATGTALGGIWANQAWGRFWGWDPKETWALVALLCYLTLLHGRLVGWWRGFGLAVGSILAFQAVLMAWYGVNFILGQGLHSYGFGNGGFGYVLAYVIAEMTFVAVAIARNRNSQQLTQQ